MIESIYLNLSLQIFLHVSVKTESILTEMNFTLIYVCVEEKH